MPRSKRKRESGPGEPAPILAPPPGAETVRHSRTLAPPPGAETERNSRIAGAETKRNSAARDLADLVQARVIAALDRFPGELCRLVSEFCPAEILGLSLDAGDAIGWTRDYGAGIQAMVVRDGRLYVAAAECIHVLPLPNSAAPSVRELVRRRSAWCASLSFTDIRGLAVHGDRLFVSDCGNNHIQILDALTGAHRCTLPLAKHSANPTFTMNRPTALAVLRDRLYVAENGSDLITSFSLDGGAMLGQFGYRQFSEGASWCGVDTIAASDDELFVLSQRYGIRVFDHNRVWKRAFSHPGTRNSRMAVLGQNLLLSDWLSHRVFVLDAISGAERCCTQQLTHAGQFPLPGPLALDGHRRIWINDGRTQRLVFPVVLAF